MEDLEFKHLKSLAKIGEQTIELFHELNNNFGIMAADLELIEYKNFAMPCELKDRINRVQQIVRRSIGLAEKTLSEVRKNKVIVSSSEFNLIMNNSIAAMQYNEFFKDINVRSCLNNDSFNVFINPDDMYQVLINILKNAVEAIAGEVKRGLIEVSTFQSEKHLIIWIANNGPAIPSNIQDKIFASFFTTKTAHGNGLGLSICKEIIEAFGGDIGLDKAYREGVKFVIKLPLI